MKAMSKKLDVGIFEDVIDEFHFGYFLQECCSVSVIPQSGPGDLLLEERIAPGPAEGYCANSESAQTS